jgi:hypothetical protein
MRIHASNNWSNPSDAAKRALYYHEVRVKVLNRVLNEKGFDAEVLLSKNLAYRTTKFDLREEENLFELSLLALQNPYDWKLYNRFRAAIRFLRNNRESIKS